jgi:hypothetical protein
MPNNNFEILGYIHKADQFFTIDQWKDIAKKILLSEKNYKDMRGGILDDDPNLINLVNKYFNYLYNIETERFPQQLPKTEVLNFIEDFINHRVWQLKDEFNEVLGDDILKVAKISFCYSRGNIEPYMMIDDTITKLLYGTTTKKITTYHWCSEKGYGNIKTLLDNNQIFELSTFTKQYKRFFRPSNNILLTVTGYLCAAFKSDVKSFLLDNGCKAINLFRMGFPGENQTNLWRANDIADIDTLQDSTYLWNEVIIKVLNIDSMRHVYTY